MVFGSQPVVAGAAIESVDASALEDVVAGAAPDPLDTGQLVVLAGRSGDIAVKFDRQSTVRVGDQVPFLSSPVIAVGAIRAVAGVDGVVTAVGLHRVFAGAGGDHVLSGTRDDPVVTRTTGGNYRKGVGHLLG